MEEENELDDNVAELMSKAYLRYKILKLGVGGPRVKKMLELCPKDVETNTNIQLLFNAAVASNPRYRYLCGNVF